MLTVVIPSRNRAGMLVSALDSISQQTLDSRLFEVIVIDNGSTDETEQAVKSVSSRFRYFKYFFEETPGLHVGRHRGMVESKGDVLVFADDDIEALPSWLEAIHDSCSDPSVVMVGGNNLPMFLQPPPPWLSEIWALPITKRGRCLPQLSILELAGPTRQFSPHLVWGCNFAIRKSVLFDAGGFHPDGMPRELLRFRGDGETHVSRFVARSGLKCLFHPGASVRHKVTPQRMTHAYFRGRGFSQGISDSFSKLRASDEEVTLLGRHTARSVAVGLWRRTQSWLRLGSDARRALAEHKRGHSEGFAFHQQCYENDEEVRAWVHQERYF